MITRFTQLCRFLSYNDSISSARVLSTFSRAEAIWNKYNKEHV